MNIEALKRRLKDAKRNERHNNMAETRYWFDQYKQIATEALAEQPAPVQQEPVAIHQFRKRGCSDWYDGLPDHHDGHGPYEVRTLYTTPQAQPKENT